MITDKQKVERRTRLEYAAPSGVHLWLILMFWGGGQIIPLYFGGEAM